jgi:hypothetical protein
MTIKTLALDLEGTLISNAVSQLPRPGLHAFTSFCLEHFSVLLFTAVSEQRTRRILDVLADEGDIPPALLAAPCVPWSGPHKDLHFILNLRPELSLKDTRIVDGLEEHIRPDQKHLWIPIR